jgi:putative transposase
MEHAKEAGLEAQTVMNDRDTKFTVAFDEVLQSARVEIKKMDYRSPNTNAFVERFIQTLQQECLDYVIVFGKEHLDHLRAAVVDSHPAECRSRA